MHRLLLTKALSFCAIMSIEQPLASTRHEDELNQLEEAEDEKRDTQSQDRRRKDSDKKRA